MTNEEILDIIDAVKDFCFLSDEQVYPVISYCCRKGYIKGWECIDDSFYVNGKKISA